MKQGTMKILFFVLKTKLLKNGEAPILMRITINGQYEETLISLGSTAVADVTVHSRNQESDFILRPSTEATPFLCF